MIARAEQSGAQRRLLEQLSQRLNSFGFNPKLIGRTFYQAMRAAMWAFHVSFIAHKTDFDLTSDVAIRVNAIEEIVNEYDTKLTAAERRRTMTLGGELGNISAGSPKRWTISNSGDIPRISEGVIEAFQKIGLPFLQEHSHLDAVHRILVSSKPADLHLAPILGPRYMRAVASSYVIGHTNEVEVLAQRYEAELSESEDPYLEDFRTLCRGLLTRSPQATAG